MPTNCPDLGSRIQRFEDETLIPVGPVAETVLDRATRDLAAARPNSHALPYLRDQDSREKLFQQLVEAAVDTYLTNRDFANRLRAGQGRPHLMDFLETQLAFLLSNLCEREQSATEAI